MLFIILMVFYGVMLLLVLGLCRCGRSDQD